MSLATCRGPAVWAVAVVGALRASEALEVAEGARLPLADQARRPSSSQVAEAGARRSRVTPLFFLARPR